MKKGVIAGVLLCMILITVVNAQLIKTTKSQYFSSDSLYVTSAVSSTDKLCRASSEAEVKLFIIENRETWNGGESLDDIRGNPSGVPNGKFSSKKVWENMKLGSFDLIIDCNDNGDFDLGEPLFNQGFTVVAKKANAVVSEGTVKIPSSSWQYDSENIDLVNEAFEINAFVEFEDVKLNNVSVQLKNSQQLNLEAIEVHVDKNTNGKVDEGDTKIGELILENSVKNNEIRNIPLDYSISSGFFESLLLVYKMKENSEAGTYSLSVVSLTGTGALSEKVVMFGGLPLESNTLTILPAKSCLGEMALSFSLASVDPQQATTAQISGLEGCDEKKVFIKSQFCSVIGGEIGSCVLKNGVCSLSLQSAVSKSYFACLDKNEDKDYQDFGESASSDLTVVIPVAEIVEPQKKEELVETNESIETGKVENEISPITGNVVNEQAQSPSVFGSQPMLVLEITLVLILFVLVMIFFRLRTPAVVENSDLELDKKSAVEINKKIK